MLQLCFGCFADVHVSCSCCRCIFCQAHLIIFDSNSSKPIALFKTRSSHLRLAEVLCFANLLPKHRETLTFREKRASRLRICKLSKLSSRFSGSIGVVRPNRPSKLWHFWQLPECGSSSECLSFPLSRQFRECSSHQKLSLEGPFPPSKLWQLWQL